MLEFEKLDAALEAAVGIAPDALLRQAAPRWADHFLLARERMSELSELTQPSSAELLERDRLGSFFGCAYGDHGFLARAGTLHTLSTRLSALADSIPALAAEPSGLGAVRREAAILGALAEHRLSQPPHPDDVPLRKALGALHASVGELAEFALAAAQGNRSIGIAQGATRLYGLADLVNVASDFKEGLSVTGVLAFVLGRLADRGFTGEGRSLLHELCESHAGRLRDALWDLAQQGAPQRGSVPTLRELRELDLALEGLKAELVSTRRAAQHRAEAVGALYALLALAHAVGAQNLAANMLDGAVLLIAEGLAAEAKKA